jgi:hypothetical protein
MSVTSKTMGLVVQMEVAFLAVLNCLENSRLLPAHSPWSLEVPEIKTLVEQL